MSLAGVEGIAMSRQLDAKVVVGAAFPLRCTPSIVKARLFAWECALRLMPV